TAVLDHRGKEIQIVEVLQGAAQYRHDCFLERTIRPIITVLSHHCSKYTLITSPIRRPDQEPRHETVAYRLQRSGCPFRVASADRRHRSRAEASGRRHPDSLSRSDRRTAAALV